MATNPEEVKAAVGALIKGALGPELEKYPLRFATPAYFGAAPKLGQEVSVNSGSAALVRLEGKPHALTCSHVLEGYRKRRHEQPDCIFQLGDCKLDPNPQVVAEHVDLDIAVLCLTDQQANEVTSGEHEFGQHFVEPPQWPPKPVAEGEFVAFGGYPGELRMAKSFKELSFGSYSSGACRVAAAHDDFIVCQFEREHWIQHKLEPEPALIRGVSGGPVFALRRTLGTDILVHEFVGIIYQFSEDYELLRIRLANVLDVSGKLRGR